MSYTSLWGVDKDWNGKELTTYKNSWLFPPTVWNCLLMKYITKAERTDRFGFTHELYLSWAMFDKDNQKFNLINGRINESENQIDRILWELTDISVMNAKDKVFIAKCVRDFCENYPEVKNNEYIRERFQKIADDIENLPDEYKFFVIHPNSVDNNVEYWFFCNGEDKKLSEWDKFICEFTLIENEKIVGFSDNLKMCKREGNK